MHPLDQPPLASASEDPASAGNGPGAPDPFASLLANLSAWWQDARAHAVLTITGTVDKLIGTVIAIVIAVLALVGVLAMVVVGGWFLVSGAAIGLELLFSSRWLGRMVAGALAVAAPVIVLAVWSHARRRARMVALARRYDQLATGGAEADRAAIA